MGDTLWFLPDPSLQCDLFRGSELDVFSAKPGSSCCPLRGIIEEENERINNIMRRQQEKIIRVR